MCVSSLAKANETSAESNFPLLHKTKSSVTESATAKVTMALLTRVASSWQEGATVLVKAPGVPSPSRPLHCPLYCPLHCPQRPFGAFIYSPFCWWNYQQLRSTVPVPSTLITSRTCGPSLHIKPSTAETDGHIPHLDGLFAPVWAQVAAAQTLGEPPRSAAHLWDRHTELAWRRWQAKTALLQLEAADGLIAGP